MIRDIRTQLSYGVKVNRQSPLGSCSSYHTRNHGVGSPSSTIGCISQRKQPRLKEVINSTITTAYQKRLIEDGNPGNKIHTSLHVGEGAIISILESHAVVVEDHVVIDGGKDTRNQRLADFTAVSMAMTFE